MGGGRKRRPTFILANGDGHYWRSHGERQILCRKPGWLDQSTVKMADLPHGMRPEPVTRARVSDLVTYREYADGSSDYEWHPFGRYTTTDDVAIFFARGP